VTRSFGLWPTALRLIAVGIDEHGRPGRPITVRRSAVAYRAMLDFFASLPAVDVLLVQAVLDDELRPESFTNALRAPKHRVWIVSAVVAEAISTAAGQRASPRTLAAILARLPALAPFRRELQRLGGAVQLELLHEPDRRSPDIAR
jgi:hypothetical protein